MSSTLGLSAWVWAWLPFKQVLNQSGRRTQAGVLALPTDTTKTRRQGGPCFSKKCSAGWEGCCTWQHLWDKEGHKEAWHEVRVPREQTECCGVQAGLKSHLTARHLKTEHVARTTGGGCEGVRATLGRARTGSPVCVKPKRRHRIRVER